MTRLVTKEGLKKLQKELQERTTAIRQQIAVAIKEAKEQGDVSENAEYSEAKRLQNENEARVAELEAIIKNSQVAKGTSLAGVVGMGSKVKVKLDGKEMEFEIVGSNEANPSERKISNESPMGKAFMGKSKGNAVLVETPAGKSRYTILDVS